MTESILVDVEKITVGQRHRKELGDLAPLMESIEDVGLLHPIIVTDSYELVAGQRRLEAVKKIGHLEIPARILPLSPAEMLRAEHDENEIRKDFTPSEQVAIGRKLEEEVARRARERMKAGQPYETVSQGSEKGPTREIVGKAVGISGPTYQRAKAVVTAAEEDPDAYGDLVEKMDQTGNVAGTFRELKARQPDPEPKPATGAKPRMMPMNSAEKIVANVSHSLHAADIALNKVELNGAENEEVAGWISDLEGPLRSIRKTLRTWKERA